MLVAWGLSDEHIAARKPWPSLPWVFVQPRDKATGAVRFIATL
jgi:hypothetical protein